MMRRVAIFIFDEVEVLDFAGPFEVFGVAGQIIEPRPFEVFTVAMEANPIIARNGLSINPTYSVLTMPQPDILLIPGGRGVRPLIGNDAVRDWIASQAPKVEQMLSVCTGAWLLAQSGLLKGLAATTYHTAFERLQELEPTARLERDVRWVDNGHVVTSAGVSAGIDMSLYVVSKLLGSEAANATAQHMEYTYWQGA